jgi:hypothetical protein
MNFRPGAYLPGGPVRLWQIGAIFFPFLLPLVINLQVFAFANGIPWLIPALGWLFLGVLVVFWVAGLVGQFPVWALPALGVLLFFPSALLQMTAQYLVFLFVMNRAYGGWPGGLTEKIVMMLLVQWVYLLMMAVAMAGLLHILPAFYARVKQEWTLLSFLLYGIAILPVLGNDEFHGIERYEAASVLILAAGAGLYLLAPRRWLRVLALVIPAILSPAVMSLGLYQTFPAQSWAVPADVSFRMWEALQPVLYLSPLPVWLLLAALAPRLPFNVVKEPAPTAAVS